MDPLFILGLASLGFGLALAWIVGGMAKADQGARVLGRKVFHAGIFSGAVPAHLLQGFWGVVVYGSVISLIVLVAFRQGPGLPFYDALARPSDGDASRRLILTPLLSTALGGLLAALLVGSFASVGYLVCGWGDAVGEGVGERWGRHRYSSLFSKEDQRSRSLEGSLAVFLAGSLGAGVALGLVGLSFSQALGFGLVCGAAGAVVEALGPSGTDNLWVQLIPSLLAWWFLG